MPFEHTAHNYSQMRYTSTERMKRKARKSTALIVQHVKKHTELNALLLNKNKTPNSQLSTPSSSTFPSLLCHKRRGRKDQFITTLGLLHTYPGGHARDRSTPPILPIKHCFKQSIPPPPPSLPPSVLPKLRNSHPVCLSPMISSLCPLPMGTKLSTALMPVCMGSRTEIRGMMPGALVPTRALLSVTIGPYNEEEDIQTYNYCSGCTGLCQVVCRE